MGIHAALEPPMNDTSKSIDDLMKTLEHHFPYWTDTDLGLILDALKSAYALAIKDAAKALHHIPMLHYEDEAVYPVGEVLEVLQSLHPVEPKP